MSGNGTTPATIVAAPTPTPPPGFVIGNAVHKSASPAGPWVPANLQILPPFAGFLTYCNNPAPLILSNGSLAIVCGFRNTSGVVYTAPSWDAPLTRHTLTMAFPPLVFNGSAVEWWVEDQNIWEDARGVFHMLTHNIEPCRLRNQTSWTTSTTGGGCGGHAYSTDLIAWSYSPEAAYSSSVEYDDGSREDYGRERPKVVQDAAGRLTHLANGFAPCCSNVGPRGRDHTWTGVVPIVTA